MKSRIISFLIIVLFLIAPFIQSDTNDDSQPDVLLGIPPLISVIAFYARWVIFILLSFYFLFSTEQIKKCLTKYNLLFILFYLFQMLYAIASNTDVARYVSLTGFAFFLPVVITSQIQETRGFLKFANFQKVVILFITLSVVVSISTIFSGFRFQGILSNANMYGISAVFWLALIQLTKKSKLNLIITVVIFASILLSGSRGSLVASIVVIFFAYSQHIKKLLIGSALLVLLITAISSFVNLEFIFGRLENISNSAAESGRQPIWDTAFQYIELNPMGNGMDAPLELINTGNIHNCYVRFLLTMGYPFTIITLACFFLLILVAVKDKSAPKPLVGFLLGYALANYGEDFFVGVGSSMFIYVVLTIGLLSYFRLKKEKI